MRVVHKMPEPRPAKRGHRRRFVNNLQAQQTRQTTTCGQCAITQNSEAKARQTTGGGPCTIHQSSKAKTRRTTTCGPRAIHQSSGTLMRQTTSCGTLMRQTTSCGLCAIHQTGEARTRIMTGGGPCTIHQSSKAQTQRNGAHSSMSDALRRLCGCRKAAARRIRPVPCHRRAGTPVPELRFDGDGVTLGCRPDLPEGFHPSDSPCSASRHSDRLWLTSARGAARSRRSRP